MPKEDSVFPFFSRSVNKIEIPEATLNGTSSKDGFSQDVHLRPQRIDASNFGVHKKVGIA